ncbi:MAG: SAF domain-containing protein [Rhodospirillaceae bacterium]|nr:SAF domain-containing protein [Rhodospirillaceae bacterium]MDD9918852.1 SAF domain-containing protein [Rhodospirillaceae bacterium]MDD9927115.1 SAF domain-containing protein [Rhodospirillaceae bacterium]
MNLHAMLKQRAASENPVRVGVIGAGKFGSMYLSQAPRTAGIHVLGIADLAPDNARAALARVGWPESQYTASSFDDARKNGTTFITEDAEALIAAVDVVVDSTGSPSAGVRHALLACEHGTHIVMVNVEADVLAGPLLAEKAAAAGIVYSMAYGDQPALICEMVDWARSCGFEVVCAGKGTKYLPEYHASTPDTVWGHYGLSAEQAAEGGMNPQMFNSFLDGTKSGIEMAAVANATGLAAPKGGLAFPACGVQDLAHILRPRADGGVLPEKCTVEVISSEERDGRHVIGDLRWGVYVTFEAPSDYVERCFAEYGLMTDETGRYSAMYKPFHLIGLELGISVASAALRGEPTGAVTGWRGDVVATAKRDLKAGEVLDGEGGFTVWGKLMRAEDSLALGGLPIGLAHNMTLKTPVAAGQPVRWSDVDYDENDTTVRFRRDMEMRNRRNAQAAE